MPFPKISDNLKISNSSTNKKKIQGSGFLIMSTSKWNWFNIMQNFFSKYVVILSLWYFTLDWKFSKTNSMGKKSIIWNKKEISTMLADNPWGLWESWLMADLLDSACQVCPNRGTPPPSSLPAVLRWTSPVSWKWWTWGGGSKTEISMKNIGVQVWNKKKAQNQILFGGRTQCHKMRIALVMH